MTATVAKQPRPRGRRKGEFDKTIEEHIREGTYRPKTHGPIAPLMLGYHKKPGIGNVLRASIKSQAKWIRNEADERAVRNGCRFHEGLAKHAAGFIPKFLRHSKGQWSGDPFSLLAWQRDDIVYPIFGWIRADGTRRFRRVYVEIPKKNGKSTLASAIGLYMLVGDNEAGAECYSLGSDRDQASIVHNEAINMCEASDDLRPCLKINRTTKTIVYKAGKAYYRAVSSNASGKEGLNIHCAIIDELHVWKGRDLWDTLKYGYRSRQQPLQFVITTAGSDMQSICRQQHDRAQGIIDGTIHDDSFLGVIYAAHHEDDWTDPEVWKKANPSLGITMKEEDFKLDCEDAKQTPSNVSAFKRYSLNIWATATNPWLDIADWNKCAADFDESTFEGKECVAGLDLSKTKDMSSLVCVFREDDGSYYLLPYFWLPAQAAKDNLSLIDYHTWAQEGYIELTSGDVIDYDYIERRVGQLMDQFKIKSIYYDPYMGEQLTQHLEKQYQIERVKFPQTITAFADPTSEFERLVLSGKLKHNEHPVLTWQAGHVQIKMDVNGNKRPIKPASDSDYRKIDGIVASIMGVAGSLIPEESKDSVYKTRGIVAI